MKARERFAHLMVFSVVILYSPEQEARKGAKGWKETPLMQSRWRKSEITMEEDGEEEEKKEEEGNTEVEFK